MKRDWSENGKLRRSTRKIPGSNPGRGIDSQSRGLQLLETNEEIEGRGIIFDVEHKITFDNAVILSLITNFNNPQRKFVMFA
tara:strand:+ start:3443 stop:3688 length:246 start_codon:yes stop_codon:yes gene_type:complete